jgi:uncharacterized protein YwgA
MEIVPNDFKKVVAILSNLNVSIKNPKKEENFQSRLIIQKLVFLSKLMGIKLNRYNFSLYKNGPYSTRLTGDYYNHPELVLDLESNYQLNTTEQYKLQKINEIVLSHDLNQYHQADFLEGVSTVYYLKNYNGEQLDDEIFKLTKEEKPFLSDKIIIIAMNIVKNLMFEEEFLTKDIQDEIDIWDKAEN